MDCLRDYIGIDWCGATTTPPSGLYINSLPGISFKSLSALSNEEQVNFAGVWDDIQTRALKRFELDVRQKFNKKWKIKSIAQSKNLGWKVDLTEPITIDSGIFTGFTVELGCDPDDDFMESALYEIMQQQLFFYSSQAVTNISATVKVFEMDSGSCIYCQTTTQNFLADSWNKVEVNFNFIKDRTINDFPIFNNSQKYLVVTGFDKPFTSYEMTPETCDFCECCGFKIRPANILEDGVPIVCSVGSVTTGWTVGVDSTCTLQSNNLPLQYLITNCFSADFDYRFTITISNYMTGSVDVTLDGAPIATLSANGTTSYVISNIVPASQTLEFLPNSFEGCINSEIAILTGDFFTSPCTAYNLLNKTINYTDNLKAVSAIIGSRCSFNRLVCSNKDVFATPLWYLLGIETINEQLNSDRLNRYTTIDLKKAERRRRELEIAYMGGVDRDELGNVIKTTQGALTQAVDGIDLDCADCCLTCEGEIKLMESTL